MNPLALLEEILYGRRCWSCLHQAHSKCWGIKPPMAVSLELLYWCECPCNTGERPGKEHSPSR